jgi:hypothetical protein
MKHEERIISAWTAEFFLHGWELYIEGRAAQNDGLMKNFISYQSRRPTDFPSTR